MGAASHSMPLGKPQTVQKITSVLSRTPCVAAQILEEPTEPQGSPGSYQPAKDHLDGQGIGDLVWWVSKGTQRHLAGSVGRAYDS